MQAASIQVRPVNAIVPVTVLSNSGGDVVLCFASENDAVHSQGEAPIVMRPVDGGCLLKRSGHDIGLAPPQSLSALLTARQINVGYADSQGVHFVGQPAGRIHFDIGGPS